MIFPSLLAGATTCSLQGSSQHFRPNRALKCGGGRGRFIMNSYSSHKNTNTLQALNILDVKKKRENEETKIAKGKDEAKAGAAGMTEVAPALQSILDPCPLISLCRPLVVRRGDPIPESRAVLQKVPTDEGCLRIGGEGTLVSSSRAPHNYLQPRGYCHTSHHAQGTQDCPPFCSTALGFCLQSSVHGREAGVPRQRSPILTQAQPSLHPGWGGETASEK